MKTVVKVDVFMFFDVCMKDNGYREVEQTNVKALQNIKAARLNSHEDRYLLLKNVAYLLIKVVVLIVLMTYYQYQ